MIKTVLSDIWGCEFAPPGFFPALTDNSLWLQTLFNQIWGEGNIEKQYPCYDGNGENDLLQALLWSVLLNHGGYQVCQS